MRVRLRDVTPEDSPKLLAWRNSPEVSVHMLADHKISQEEHDAWFAAVATRRDRRYWVIDLDEHPVGLTNLAAIDEASGSCEWAYYLGDPATRGRGIGSCVEYMVLRHVFQGKDFRKVVCQVLADNAASLGFLESIGFHRLPIAPLQVMKGGQLKDVIELVLPQPQWPHAKAVLEDRLRLKGVDPTGLPTPP